MISRALAALAVASLATAALAQPLQGFEAAASVPPALPLTPFYEAPAGLDAARPGDLLKSEPIAAPPGAKAWRVMYASRTWDDRPVAVTGWIAAPEAAAPGPRPVLSWAHGTTGVARGCAPSLAPDPARSFLPRGGAANFPVDIGGLYLDELLARGYVVVATDYQGQGGPGAHQYLVGETAARGALDIARAAARLPAARAGRDVAVLGWSQGGQAALFAGEIASAYAPDLTVRGVAALAPPAVVWHDQIDPFFRAGTPHGYSILSGYGAAYGLPLDMLTDRGRELTAAAGEGCVLELFKQIGRSTAPGVVGDVTAAPGWTEALQRNDAGRQASAPPVLVVQGTADNIVLPAGTRLYQQRACAAGSRLEVDWIEGGDHRSIMPAARDRILAWLDARLRGEPPSENVCAAPPS
ncbi:lipase family protein [Phenylobacterium sp.]|uniref:lipase family protein n=1 Tax=Phenylobacterium sp. TaxID=1871053 RepID=UPI00289DC51B|nr:lipase family protein [Phenylobacterium sp.]